MGYGYTSILCTVRTTRPATNYNHINSSPIQFKQFTSIIVKSAVIEAVPASQLTQAVAEANEYMPAGHNAAAKRPAEPQ